MLTRLIACLGAVIHWDGFGCELRFGLARAEESVGVLFVLCLILSHYGGDRPCLEVQLVGSLALELKWRLRVVSGLELQG